MDNPEKPSSSHTHASAGRDWVPALEVPLGTPQYHEDEMVSWLQYPLEDSFDKMYCSEELSMAAPTSHSSFVHDALSSLTLKEGEKLYSTGLSARTYLPSDLKLREREGGGNVHMASHTWDVAAAYDTNRGERVLAANTAMAIGAHRAAGLLLQSGSETFKRVRTNVQPHLLERAQNLTTQESGGGAIARTSKAGDEKNRFQPSVCRLTSSNFPLFSRIVSGSQQNKLGVGVQGRGGDSVPKGEKKESAASPVLHAHPTLWAPRSIARMTDIGFTSRTDITSTNSISRKLGAEAISTTSVEETSMAPTTLRADKGSPSFSAATASACHTSDPSVGFSGALPQTESKRQHLTADKGIFDSDVKSTFTTGVESSMYSELACNDSERSQNITGYGGVFPLYKSGLGASEEFDSSLCPVVTGSGLITSERKIFETVERGDISMESPSSDISEKSIKEAAAFTMKRKAHFAEDNETESKSSRDEKLSQEGCASVAKRSRAAEIHNLSERKRRDTINVQVKTLQDLIPNTNKTDKASVLDEAIEYMKLLKSEVQLMSLRTEMAAAPMLLSPGMSSAPTQQRLQPPHPNLDLGTHVGFRLLGMDVFGPPFSGSPYNTHGLQPASSQAGVQAAYTRLQHPGENEAYMLSPQRQHFLSNTHTTADMFGAYTIQQEPKAPKLELPQHDSADDTE